MPCARTNESTKADKNTEDSSILETANLMKSSVFLSPTFTNPLTNINAEVEFLSFNQDAICATVDTQKQVSNDLSNFSAPQNRQTNNEAKDCLVTKKKRSRRISNRNKSVIVGPETKIDARSEMIENLRRKIQTTIESVLANPEEMKHVDIINYKTVVSTDSDTLEPAHANYMIPENTLRDFSDKSEIGDAPASVSGTVATSVESKQAGVDDIVTEDTMKDLNYRSEIVDTPNEHKTNPFEKGSHVYCVEGTICIKESLPDYLDNPAIVKSPDIIETLIEINNAERTLTEEIEREIVMSRNNTNTYVTEKPYFVAETQKPQTTHKHIENEVLNAKAIQEVNFVQSQIIEYLNKVETNDNTIYSHSHRDCTTAAHNIPDTSVPQENYGDIDGLESVKPVLIAAEAILLDDHLDEAYLSDCSNSNLGPSGCTGTVPDLSEPLSKQEAFTEVKNSKINILSEEIIEPSTFNNILNKAKKSMQKDNFIPVSISTVVSLRHKNTSPDYSKMDLDIMKIELNQETVRFLESNGTEDNAVSIEFVDENYQNPKIFIEGEPSSDVNTETETNMDLQMHVEEAASLASPFTNLNHIDEVAESSSNCMSNEINTITETNAMLQAPQKRDNENASSSQVSLKSLRNEISNGPNKSKARENKKDCRDEQPKSEVKEIASYLSKFAHILAHRKKNSLKDNGKEAQHDQTNLIHSKLTQEGVEKPGGANIIYESREDDECHSHKIWRTYKISQRLPSIPNSYVDFRTAVTITTDDKITVQNSTPIEDINVDFDLSEDFGSFCYYDTNDDLYEHFKLNSVQISLEELLYENDIFSNLMFPPEAVLGEICFPTKDLTVDNENTRIYLNPHPIYVSGSDY